MLIRSSWHWRSETNTFVSAGILGRVHSQCHILSLCNLKDGIRYLLNGRNAKFSVKFILYSFIKFRTEKVNHVHYQ